MKEIYYLNSKNERVNFIDEVPLFSIDAMFGYTFTVETDNDIITDFSKGVTKYTLSCDVPVGYFDNIMDIFDYDIYNNAKGKFYIGDYYLLCNITGQSTSNVNLNKKTIKTSLTVTTDVPNWIREIPYEFLKETAVEKTSTVKSKKFSYAYSYVYGREIGRSEVNNPSFKDANFRLIIYGPVDSPEVTINGHLYKLNVSINAGEYVIIDSSERSILCYDLSGKTVNYFEYRNLYTSIFQRITPGLNEVLWSGSFGFDLIVFDERSRPKWI